MKAMPNPATETNKVCRPQCEKVGGGGHKPRTPTGDRTEPRAPRTELCLPGGLSEVDEQRARNEEAGGKGEGLPSSQDSAPVSP